MINEERNTALYQKMFAEQESFRDWLKGQPPEEILNHAYEYTIREDILLSLEYHDLSDAQVYALMNSPSPLADVFKDFEKLETHHMETVWDCLENRADAILESQRRVLRETPLYAQSAAYANAHGELEQYWTSRKVNAACKEAIENSIRDHYSGHSLGVGRGVKDGYMSGHAGGQADRAAQPGPQDDPGHQLNGHGGQNYGEDLDEGQ